MGKSALAAYLYNKADSVSPTSPASPASPTSPASPSFKFWADVSQNPDFAVFAEKIITGLGGKVTQPGDITQLVNDLLKCLNQRRCLLVVDNLETLLNESRKWQNSAYDQFFSRWLQQGSNSTLLLTTQEKPIMFQQEGVWHSLKGIKTSDGATLLQRLHIQGTAAELEGFVDYVDGHPLTLELVAGYLREYCYSQLSGIQEFGLEQFELVYDEAQGLHRDKQDARLSWILQQHLQRLTPERQSFLVK